MKGWPEGRYNEQSRMPRSNSKRAKFMSKHQTTDLDIVDGTRRSKSSGSSVESKEEPEERWFGHIVSAGIGGLAFALYVGTAYQSVPGGDSGELIAAAEQFGVGHPPGYPLFTLLSWLVIKLVPVGQVAWRVNMLNALFSGLALMVLASLIIKLTDRYSCAVLAVGMWGFCRLTWTWSTTAEVFGLNNFFTCLLLLVTHIYSYVKTVEKKMKLSVVGAFVCGLALCNQHTLVIYVACIAVYVLVDLYNTGGMSATHLLSLTLATLTGLLPYLYLPLSSHLGVARWTWGDQRSLSGFLKHLLRQEYGTFDLGKDHTGPGFSHSLRTYISHVTTDLTPFIILLFCIGTLHMLTRIRKDKYLVLIWSMMLFYITFFSWRANLDVKNPLLLGVVERFWMQCDVIITIVAAVAYDKLIRYTESLSNRNIPLHADTVVAVVITFLQIQRNFTQCNQYSNRVVHDFGLEILKDIPYGSIVLTKGDLPSNVLRYLYLCEHMRPDISLFDQEILTYDWSVPMLGKASGNITFPGDMLHLTTGVRPDGRQSFNFKTFLDINYPRAPIFGCIGIQDHEPSWQQAYELWPFGVCVQFVRKGEFPNIESYVKMTSRIAQNWTATGFDPTTWEHVASNEMWHAKISSAFFMYEMAGKAHSNVDKTNFFLHSYTLYTKAIDNNKGYPAHWNKNYALVCERLIHLDHDLDKVMLIKKSMDHFQRFIDLEPSDRDAEAIKNIIKDLRKHFLRSLSL